MAVRIVCLIMGLLIAVAGTASADDRRILDVLLKKGIISRVEYAEILAEADAPEKRAPPEAARQEQAPSGLAGPAGEPVPHHPVGSKKDLETISGGIENLRKEGYRNVFTTVDSLLKHSERLSVGIVALKAQYNADNTDRKPSGTTPDTADSQGTLRDENGFRIRAAEIYVTGRLTPWSTYYFETDFSRQSEIVLNSMYLDFYSQDIPYLKAVAPYVSQIRVGQFREPFGIEQGTSQGLLDFINRAYYTDLRIGQNGSSVAARVGDPGLNPFGKDNSTGFMQQLDVGIQLFHRAPQLPWAPELQWAVVNGSGRNFNDNNADKDLTGRLILTPTEGMKLYLAGYAGTSFYAAPNGATNILPVNHDIRKTRQGVMYTYIPPDFPRLKLQGEYIEGQDNGFRRRTWYNYVLFRPFESWENFEAAYRFEEFTVDTNRPDSTLDRHTIGFNYYFHTNVKFTLNYEIRRDQNQNSTPLAPAGHTNANNQNLLTTQIQFRY